MLILALSPVLADEAAPEERGHAPEPCIASAVTMPAFGETRLPALAPIVTLSGCDDAYTVELHGPDDTLLFREELPMGTHALEDLDLRDGSYQLVIANGFGDLISEVWFAVDTEVDALPAEAPLVDVALFEDGSALLMGEDDVGVYRVHTPGGETLLVPATVQTPFTADIEDPAAEQCFKVEHRTSTTSWSEAVEVCIFPMTSFLDDHTWRCGFACSQLAPSSGWLFLGALGGLLVRRQRA